VAGLGSIQVSKGTLHDHCNFQIKADNDLTGKPGTVPSPFRTLSLSPHSAKQCGETPKGALPLPYPPGWLQLQVRSDQCCLQRAGRCHQLRVRRRVSGLHYKCISAENNIWEAIDRLVVAKGHISTHARPGLLVGFVTRVSKAGCRPRAGSSQPGRSIMIRDAYPGPTDSLRSFMEGGRDAGRREAWP
jgi:hypothetical protein